MKGAAFIVDELQKGVAVLVHCSDGWDRTAQLTALAQVSYTVLYPILSYPILSYHTSAHGIGTGILYYPVLSYPILSYFETRRDTTCRMLAVAIDFFGGLGEKKKSDAIS